MTHLIQKALRSVIIDWLQFSNEFDETRAQDTLTYIWELEMELNRYKKSLKEIITEQTLNYAELEDASTNRESGITEGPIRKKDSCI